MIRRIHTSVGAIVLAVLLAASANAAFYTFTSFDGPGNNGGGTTVNGINNNGDVVCFSSDNAANPTLLTNFIRNPNGTFTRSVKAGFVVAVVIMFLVGGRTSVAVPFYGVGVFLPIMFIIGKASGGRPSAPAICAPLIAAMPTPPQPITATVSPACTFAVFTTAP